jgi:heat shock protein HslJ
MRQLTIAFAIGAIAVATAACSAAGGSPKPAGGTGGTIEGVNWRLGSFAVSGKMTDVPPGVIVDATFASDRVSGSSGCNSYNGPAIVTGATLKIGPLSGTLMACVGPGGDVETAYLPLLTAATSFTATADALTLYDASGTPTLIYSAGAANPLEGEWNVTGYNNGKEAVVSPVSETTLTATFTGDQVSGSAGCNDYSGPYTLDGDKVAIGPLVTTRKACEQPSMDQETQFLTALQTPSTVEQNGGIITLRAASGATQVTLVAK